MAAGTCDTPFNFLKRLLTGLSFLLRSFHPRKEHQKMSSYVTRSPQSFLARTWQAQDQSSGETDISARAPPLYLNAASSGFSLSVTCPPSSFTTILHPSQSFNLILPGLYVIHPTVNTSQSPTSSAIAACLLRQSQGYKQPWNRNNLDPTVEGQYDNFFQNLLHYIATVWFSFLF